MFWAKSQDKFASALRLVVSLLSMGFYGGH
jgi:hypothetical protein